MVEPSNPTEGPVIMEPHQYWTESMTSRKILTTLREHGLHLDPLVYEWVATQGESHPTPDIAQISVFTTHCECGFGV